MSEDKKEKKNLKHKSKGKKELEELKKEREEYKEGWARAQADYQNLQKEIENKRGEWAKMSEAQVLEEFIPVYDNFKKAFGSDTDTRINADVADNADSEKERCWMNWKQGIGYIMKQFGDIFARHNIEEIKTVGEQFDPRLHEAVGEAEPEGEVPMEIGKVPMEVGEGEIIKEVEGGYKIGDKVIKCAKVVVSK